MEEMKSELWTCAVPEEDIDKVMNMNHVDQTIYLLNHGTLKEKLRNATN